MNKLIFFYRRSNPVFFSIEKVFGNIAKELQHRYSSEFSVEEIKLPFFSKPRNIFKNIFFTRVHQGLINHITGDVHYAILGCNRKKINVLTIHDCVPLRNYPKTDPRYWIIKWVWYSLPVRKADHVTVISENTRRELVDLTHVSPGKISVISNFVDPCFQPAPALFNSNCPRILFIGTTPYKNIGCLIEALKDISVVLDIVGELSEEQLEWLKKGNIQYEQSAKLSREELIGKYRNCDLLAFPSTYEGFGLPIIEAQAVGRPVLTSNLSPMRDVAGEGACLVDPYDVSSIRKGLQKIIGEQGYRNKIITEGFKNIEKFKLDKIADQYVFLYRELLQKKSVN